MKIGVLGLLSVIFYCGLCEMLGQTRLHGRELLTTFQGKNAPYCLIFSWFYVKFWVTRKIWTLGQNFPARNFRNLWHPARYDDGTKPTHSSDQLIWLLMENCSSRRKLFIGGVCIGISPVDLILGIALTTGKSGIESHEETTIDDEQNGWISGKLPKGGGRGSF